MRSRLLSLVAGVVVAVMVLSAPAVATHEGIEGIALDIEGDCFVVHTNFGFQPALKAEVRVSENRDDVVRIVTRFQIWGRNRGETEWLRLRGWSHKEATANGETLTYDEGAAGLGAEGDWRLTITVWWFGADGVLYQHRFTAAQWVDGECVDRTYPRPPR